MDLSLQDIIALATLIIWPAIPLFWVPVHCLPRVFRRLGRFTYALPVVTWLPLAFFIVHQRSLLLEEKAALPAAVRAVGIIVLLLGIALQVWTFVLLTPGGIVGLPEVSEKRRGRMVTTGPFSVVRHPTYLSHTLMYLGVFLLTGVVTVAIATVVDAIAVNAVVIPLEERELAERFGGEYDAYKRKVPSRFLPSLFHKN